jgi:hypothetical protein
MTFFKYKKAVQALNFFAIKENGAINKMKALKLIWLADRYHIRKYGRPITFDSYLAMKLGPVPSGAKDLAQANNPFLDPLEKEYRDSFIFPNSNNLNFSSIAGVETKVFSKTDMDALDYIYSTFGDKDQFKLSEYSHTLPDWKKYEQLLNSGHSRIDMKYDDFFLDKENSDFDITDEEHLQFAKELFDENSLYA